MPKENYDVNDFLKKHKHDHIRSRKDWEQATYSGYQNKQNKNLMYVVKWFFKTATPNYKDI